MSPLTEDHDELEGEDVELEAIPADAKTVAVWRITEDGRQEYCQRWAASEYSVDKVRALWGGGYYLQRPRGADGRWGKSATFRVAGEPRTPPLAQDPAPGDSRLDRLEALVERLIENRAAPPAEDAATPPGVGGLAVELSKVATQQFKSLVDLFGQMEDRRAPAPPTSAAATAKETIDTLMQGVKLGQELAGGGGGRYDTVVDRFGVPLLEFLQKQREDNRAAPPAAAPALPQAATAPPPPPPPASVTPRPAKLSPFGPLAPQVPTLLELASQNADVRTWAALIESQAGEQLGVLEALADRLGRDGTLEEFLSTFPQARDHADWFGRLFDELLTQDADIVDDDDAGEEDRK